MDYIEAYCSNSSEESGQFSGIYELEDDYGASYYFRGDIDYNYVKFGTWQTDLYQGFVDYQYYELYSNLSDCESVTEDCTKIASEGDDMYWRIVRINGDGTIRMIYDGTRTYGKDNYYDYDAIRSIGKSPYNQDTDDNAYIGYMYGTPESDNYEDTHANIHNSTIKTYIDSWYEQNLKDTANEAYIADSIFCNDRSVASEDTIRFANTIMFDEEIYSTNAFGSNWAIYGAYGRDIDQFERMQGNKATFICPQKNDAFTVSDTYYGNGALTYPVGLITFDEVNAAGTDKQYGYNSYIGYFDGYWTMSPENINDIIDIYDGFITSGDNFYKSNVRPVINLKPNSLTSGDGTSENPFQVSP